MDKISYELAKELKDAGFPQEWGVGRRYYTFPDFDGQPSTAVTTRSVGDWGDFHDDEGDVAIPTLSELIEACGDRFDELRRIHTGEFVAETIGREPQIGSTPEEAVARLWLALNRKE